MDDLKNKRVTVAGLGNFGGGIGAARWLCEQGARVLVTDTSDAHKLANSVQQLNGLPIEYRLGEHRSDDFTSCDLVVATPAMAPSNPYLQAARNAGVPITTEICLFVQRCPLPILAVSGTKGKSTTSQLLSLMLATQYHVWLGGNIGKSLLADLPNMKPGQLVLLEVSSFMLEYLSEIGFAPRLSLLTMLGHDHVEWHLTPQAYLAAKRKLIEKQSQDDVAVLGEGCDIAHEFAKHTQAKVIWYGVEGRQRFTLALPGEHNQLNAQAAFAAAASMGISWDGAQNAIGGFLGLAHRLQLVHQANGIRFYDDSIATIPQAAAVALGSFPPAHVLQIVGGHDKQLPFESLCDALAGRAKAVLCIGETGGKIASLLRARHPNFTAVYETQTLANALLKAKEIGTAGDIVLLSPGCSSYDQFVNFQQRGNLFTAEAKRLFV